MDKIFIVSCRSKWTTVGVSRLNDTVGCFHILSLQTLPYPSAGPLFRQGWISCSFLYQIGSNLHKCILLYVFYKFYGFILRTVLSNKSRKKSHLSHFPRDAVSDFEPIIIQGQIVSALQGLQITFLFFNIFYTYATTWSTNQRTKRYNYWRHLGGCSQWYLQVI